MVMLCCCGNVAMCRKPHLSVYSSILYFEHAYPKLNFVLISPLTGKCATQNLNKNLGNSSQWTCSHLMSILRSQKKNKDFLMI